VAAAVADAVAAPVAWPYVLRPDAGVIIIALAAVPWHASGRRWPAAWTCGLVKDLFAAGPLGIYALLGLACALLWEHFARHVAITTPPGRALAAAIGAIVLRAVPAVLFGSAAGVAPAALVTACVAAFAALAGHLRPWSAKTSSFCSPLR
jgi:rod shape-determining protein MreD